MKTPLPESFNKDQGFKTKTFVKKESLAQVFYL